MIRGLLILIPLITLIIPQRWFSTYAYVVIALAVTSLGLLAVEYSDHDPARDSSGAMVFVIFVAFNLLLLLIRLLHIRRIRARMLKLPAPAPKE